MRTQAAGRGLHNVPAELTSFVGRRHELAEIKQRLGSARLVTLTGPGGVGKTRLALRAATELVRAFPDGVWLVPLAPIEDPQLVTQAVFQSLGLQDRSAGWALSGLTDHLAEKHALLILDNCEHVLDSCAVLATTLLKACPELRLLATSRQVLGTEGEIRLRVPSLSLPDDGGQVRPERLLDFDAVALLAERATAVLPNFSVEASNAADVVRLCRRLDGIPLALELAAVRLEGLGLGELNRALDAELPVLGEANRRIEARQRTLEATIDWSYRLLSEDERRAWDRLSVFAGGFDEQAAGQVCSGPDLPAERILPLLATLVEKSILKRDPSMQPARYQLLETLRQFGRHRLRARGDEVEFRLRHRDWVRELTAAAGSWDQRQADVLDRIHRERDNLWAALDFCLRQPGESAAGIEICRSLYVYWHVRGPFHDTRRVLAALRALTATDSLPRAQSLWVEATLAVVENDFDAAATMLEESLRIGQKLDDFEVIGQSVLYLCVIAWVRGRPEEAVAKIEAIVARARQRNSLPILLGGLNLLASIELARGDAGRVVALGEQAIPLSVEMGELWVRGLLLNSVSQAHWQRGELKEAEQLAREGAAIKYALHDGVGLAINLESLAMMAVERGAAERAATLMGAAEILRESAVTDVFGPYRAQHERSASAARERLGDVAFAADVARGRALTPEQIVPYALDQKTPAVVPPRATVVATPLTLTRREREIAALVAEGLSNKQIAARLVISERTAESHILNILNKLGFNSRTQIAGWAATHSPAVVAKH